MHDMIIAVALKAIHPILIAAPPTLYADLTVTFPIHSARKEVDTVTATSGTAGHNLRTCYTTRRAQFSILFTCTSRANGEHQGLRGRLTVTALSHRVDISVATIPLR